MPPQSWFYRPAPDPTQQPEGPATSAVAAEQLLCGNRRFADEAAACVCPGPIPTPPKQAPFGVVLGCSDARAPLELVFDAAPNQLFVVRVAGNVLGDECLGSIEYAMHNFQESVRLLIVLGHTGCGAVAAAVDTYMSPKHHAGIAFSRSLRSVVNHILVAVRSAALSLEQTHSPDIHEDPGYTKALAALAVPLNAAMVAYQLRQELKTHETGGPDVVYGVFDLITGRVAGPPDLDSIALSPAPSRPEELVELGLRLARTPTITQHLMLLGGPFADEVPSGA